METNFADAIQIAAIQIDPIPPTHSNDRTSDGPEEGHKQVVDHKHFEQDRRIVSTVLQVRPGWWVANTSSFPAEVRRV
jgi:hypothetical protein